MRSFILFLLSSALFGQHSSLYQHVQAGPIDAYIDSSAYTQPAMPGMGQTLYSIAVSVSTTDSDAIAFAVYIKVELADGSLQVLNQTVGRDTTYGAFTCLHFPLPQKPARVVRFAVTRLHQVDPDVLIEN